MYEFLLFMHLLSAFALLALVVMFTSFTVGGPAPRPAVTLSSVLGAIGGIGTLVFGIWLAIYVDGYDLLDAWIVAAIVLWLAGGDAGRRAEEALKSSLGAAAGAAAVKLDPWAMRWHLIRTVLIVLLLADMIFKPWAS